MFVFPDTSENAVLSLSFPPVSVFNDGSRTGDKSSNIGVARRGASTWVFTRRASRPFSRLHLHHLKELREEGMIEVLDKPEGKKGLRVDSERSVPSEGPDRSESV